MLLVKQQKLLAVHVVVMQANQPRQHALVSAAIQIMTQKQHAVAVLLTLAKLVIQHVLIHVTFTAAPPMFTKIQLAQVWSIASKSVPMI